MKTYKSKYDLDNEYRLMLKSLMEDAQAVCRQYEYADFAGGVFSVSYKRKQDWFLEGLIPRLRDEKQGVKERDKLRKGTKNYYSVYRDEQGLIRKAASYVDGKADVTYFAVYKESKRYLLPFSDVWQGRYPTYTIVAEYSGGEIIREYMANDSQIVYYGYEKRSEEEYRVEVINYIPKGDYPVNAYEVFIVSLASGIAYSDERSYSWYDEFNCQRKGLPYMQELPEHMIAADMTEEQLNEELEKGYATMQEGNAMPVDEAFANVRKGNHQEYLVDLIKRMSEKDDARTSDSSVSWQAHREAESLSDPSAFPILIGIVESSPQKKARDIRDNAYFIIGKLLKNSFDREACDFLIRRLNAEDNKYVLSHILDRLAELTLPIEMDITPIVSCSKSEKWLVRHSALCALGASATKQSRDALAFYLEQDDEKQYRYEMIYANASLGRIGNAEDIPLIEKHLHSRSPGIRESARFAIERIKLGGN